MRNLVPGLLCLTLALGCSTKEAVHEYINDMARIFSQKQVEMPKGDSIVMLPKRIEACNARVSRVGVQRTKVQALNPPEYCDKMQKLCLEMLDAEERWLQEEGQYLKLVQTSLYGQSRQRDRAAEARLKKAIPKSSKKADAALKVFQESLEAYLEERNRLAKKYDMTFQNPQ